MSATSSGRATSRSKVMLIPQYEIFQNLNMINSLWPLFIRAFFGNAF